VLTAATGLAQSEEKAKAEEVIALKTTVLDVTRPLHVEGEIVKPTESFLRTKPKVGFDLLVPVRDNFLPEMMKTAGSL
jgi:hypothetical protein